MITVQAFHGADQEGTAVPKEYERDQKRGKDRPAGKVGPFSFLVMIGAFAVYLKSFLPVTRAEPAKEPDGPHFSKPADEAVQISDEEISQVAGVENTKSSDDPGDEEEPEKESPVFTSSYIPELGSVAGPLSSTSDRAGPSTAFAPLGGARPNNDNFPPALEIGNGPGFRGAGGGGGDGASGSSGGGSKGGSNPPHPDPDLPPIPGGNRAPRHNGPVRLQDMVGFHAYFLPIAALLAGSVDPDGDTLGIVDLVPSRGTVTPVDGGWIFSGITGRPGDVTFSYSVSDGEASVAQVAHLLVVNAPPILGTDSGDQLLGTPDDDEIYAGLGDDNIDAREGDDVVDGGPGDDHIVAGEGADVIYAGYGSDVVYGGSGNDIIFGGGGRDRLFGEDGNDTIFGEAGDDLLIGGRGDDELIGGPGGDELRGDEGNDVLRADEGNDRLFGGDGNDIMFGGAGADTIDGGEGNDIISDGAGRDVVDGGSGDDHILAAIGNEADHYAGGSGVDTLDYSLSNSDITVNAAGGSAHGDDIGTDTISGFEEIITGSGDDHLIVGSDYVQLTGGAGNDLFDFHRSDEERHPLVVARITDFTIGDKLYVATYEIKYRDLDDFLDEVEDAFKSVYVDDAGDRRPVRIKFDKLDETDITVIEVQGGDGVDDTYSIQLDGRHTVGLTISVVG